MASTIIIKNGAGGSTPSSLKQGELAINVDSGSLYYGTSGSSNAVSSSFHIANLTASGDISASGTIYAQSFESPGDVELDINDSINVVGGVTASGNISSSATLLGTDLDIRAAGVQKAAIDTSGNIITTGKVVATNDISSSAAIEANSISITNNGDNIFSVSNAGVVSASGKITGQELELASSGTVFATITRLGSGSFAGGIDCIGDGKDATGSFGYISASGDISTSGMMHALKIKAPLAAGTDNSVVVLNSSNELVTDEIRPEVWGGEALLVTSTLAEALTTATAEEAVGNASTAAAAETTKTQRTNTDAVHYPVFVTDNNSTATAEALKTSTNYLTYNPNDGTAAIRTVSSSALISNTIELQNNGVNTLGISNAGAISASSTIQGTAFTAQTNGATKATIDASGNVAAEGYISSSGKLSGTDIDLRTNGAQVFAVNTDGIVNAEGGISSSALLSGTSLDIKSAGVTKAQIDAEGGVTASAYQGTKHILRCMSFYINDNPWIQNSIYFGGTLQHQQTNWNDPQAVGGTIATTANFNIAEDDMNWGIILPFDVSAIEVQCSVRPALGNGDTYTLAIYTGARHNGGGDANITLTKVANQNATIVAAEYVTNDLTYTANLDKGTMIYVGVGSSDATDAKNARGIMNIIATQR
jgi:hypothetical protein